GPYASGFEAGEFDGGGSGAVAAFFFKLQRDEELAFIQEECDEGVASTRKGDRLRRGESTCRKAGCYGLNARRICWHAGFRESGAIHRCARRRSLGHLFVRRNSLVYAHRPQAFPRRHHRTDSHEPALACLTDGTTESRAGARWPDH